MPASDYNSYLANPRAMTGHGLVGWVSTPDVRGTLSIIYGCATVIITAIWTILHLNVPGKTEGFKKALSRRIRWGVFAIVAPDLLTLVAACQWVSARRSVEQMRELNDPGPWTSVHAFYADSGGFLLQPQNELAFPVNAKQIHFLVSHSYIPLPTITHDEIWDKSKADWFAKGFVLLQIGWIIIQSVARVSVGLAISPLEIFTLAFVVSTIMSYFFWWNKPQDVRTPTILYCEFSIARILTDSGIAPDASSAGRTTFSMKTNSDTGKSNSAHSNQGPTITEKMEFRSNNGLPGPKSTLDDLGTAVKGYPGVTLDSANAPFHSQPRSIYRSPFQPAANEFQDGSAPRYPVDIPYGMFNTPNRITRMTAYSATGVPFSQLLVEYHALWEVILPGQLIYTSQAGTHRVLKLKAIVRGSDCLWLRLEKIINGGTLFGYAEAEIRIPEYSGSQPLNHLHAFPLQYHPEQGDIRKALIARGKKYSPTDLVHGDGLRDINVDGRIMVDCAKFARVTPTFKPNISRIKAEVLDHEGLPTLKWKEGAVQGLSDDELLLCDHVIPGFSFDDNMWCSFKLDHIQEVEYDADAFKSLILPEEKKVLLHGLVGTYDNRRPRCSEPTRGEEKGMIVLLYGRHGVGKTLAAESIADYIKRPLYRVNPGELGARAYRIKRVLSSIVSLATRWNAIILIENVDAYLEPRSRNPLRHSNFITAFLKRLKSHNGVVFLTTAHVEAISLEFLHDIPIPVGFPALSLQTRRELWKRILGQPDWLEDRILDSLAFESENGQVINIMMGILSALAGAAKRELGPEDVKTLLEVAEALTNELLAQEGITEQLSNVHKKTPQEIKTIWAQITELRCKRRFQ
ncbi:hypothetical protein GQX73_g9767 [Xylaria multiplex]|uniref:AAA+ ATPase domain-containing protein n=1 Tax=Xylaria multiplex TaxID=323545 RepID=A0A7C8IHJ5_9PEZI|nr:hypothetical protein GQX73_g9767 [Xylaria multiplex]